jgi:hypothetical protein
MSAPHFKSDTTKCGCGVCADDIIGGSLEWASYDSTFQATTQMCICNCEHSTIDVITTCCCNDETKSFEPYDIVTLHNTCDVQASNFGMGVYESYLGDGIAGTSGELEWYYLDSHLTSQHCIDACGGGCVMECAKACSVRSLETTQYNSGKRGVGLFEFVCGGPEGSSCGQNPNCTCWCCYSMLMRHRDVSSNVDLQYFPLDCFTDQISNPPLCCLTSGSGVNISTAGVFRADTNDAQISIDYDDVFGNHLDWASINCSSNFGQMQLYCWCGARDSGLAVIPQDLMAIKRYTGGDVASSDSYNDILRYAPICDLLCLTTIHTNSCFGDTGCGWTAIGVGKGGGSPDHDESYWHTYCDGSACSGHITYVDGKDFHTTGDVHACNFFIQDRIANNWNSSLFCVDVTGAANITAASSLLTTTGAANITAGAASAWSVDGSLNLDATGNIDMRADSYVWIQADQYVNLDPTGDLYINGAAGVCGQGYCKGIKTCIDAPLCVCSLCTTLEICADEVICTNCNVALCGCIVYN